VVIFGKIGQIKIYRNLKYLTIDIDLQPWVKGTAFSNQLFMATICCNSLAKSVKPFRIYRKIK